MTTAAPQAVEVLSAPESNWALDNDTNEVTGVVTTTAYLKGQGKQNIYVRRTGKKLECYITTDEFLETVRNLESGYSTVVYRFDSGKPTRQGWHLGSSNEDLFYPGTPKAFLVQMSKAKELKFQYESADKVPAVISFDVGGLPATFSSSLASQTKSLWSHLALTFSTAYCVWSSISQIPPRPFAMPCSMELMSARI